MPDGQFLPPPYDIALAEVIVNKELELSSFERSENNNNDKEDSFFEQKNFNELLIWGKMIY